MKKIIFLICFLGILSESQAQDPQFTQFYAAPLYHNPAFAGSGYAPRVMINYRNQWPSLDANFKTTLFSVDHYFEKAKSGIGLTLLDDDQGNRINNTEINLLYSYQLQVSDKSFLRLGLQAGYSSRGFDNNGLIYGDQISSNGVSTTPSSDPFAYPNFILNKRNVDVGTGLLYYNPKFYLGFTFSHLANFQIKDKPLKDPAKPTTTISSDLPGKLLLNVGYNIKLSNPSSSAGNSDKEFVITPTALYKKQGSFSQLDLGFYATYTPITFGMWYRGIPLKKVFKQFPNQDAFSVLAGFRFDNFSLGYSYDFTISGLRKDSGGSHEISLSYQLEKSENDRTPYFKQRKKELACPKF